MNIHSRKHVVGLTLIEVLIALAIIAIAMTAIIKATTQNIRGTAYLQSKTMAMWVGQEVLNEARVGLIKFDGSETVKDTTNLLGRDWYWQAEEQETPNKRIKKISVSVYSHEIENNDDSPVITLETFRYIVPDDTTNVAAPGEDHVER